MYSLYFQDKIISFTSQPPPKEDISCSFIAPRGGKIAITKVVEKVENCKQLYICSREPRADFERFCLQFERVDAAGGVVRNREADVLMILRNGRWDLPKGHVEDGEKQSDAALREVWEETGIGGEMRGGNRDMRCETEYGKRDERCEIEGGKSGELLLGELIVVTSHFYPFEDRWRIKDTYWYSMRYNGEQSLKGQSQEGIERVEWVAKEQLDSYISECFASVKEVLRLLGLLSMEGDE